MDCGDTDTKASPRHLSAPDSVRYNANNNQSGPVALPSRAYISEVEQISYQQASQQMGMPSSRKEMHRWEILRYSFPMIGLADPKVGKNATGEHVGKSYC